ncbi:MAG: aminoglycoside phosphotransferase family protein [Bacilli bacterium]|nr:aminoglycoside phosphotransferase family protein [Bacilli bacterium]MDD4077295.1 aminoglycoside phosphotransferase family protein [Bacilli bacterium]MDD4388218.1 aminoglycoside phosphotransferase family protein [Bacilli bacterium]
MQKIFRQYSFGNEIKSINPFGHGHINKTYLVVTGHGERFILQRINHDVFKKPKEVMRNIELVTKHIRNQVKNEGKDPSRAALEIIPTINKKTYAIVDDYYWRCYRYVFGARTYEIIEKPELFYEVGKAVGVFQKQLNEFPIGKLHITIPDFHNTPVRFKNFVEATYIDPDNVGLNTFNEVKFVFDRKNIMNVITDMLDKNEIPERVTHNDTKLNNIMIDENTNKAICVIDLDTVMPGSVLYDFGDAIRVGASTAVEDEPDLSRVQLDVSLFELFSRGFLEETHRLLNQKEIDHLVEGARLITLECGMRFLTDYFKGNTYFSISYPKHNLVRARAQFKLVEEIEKNYSKLQNIIKNIINDLE